MRDFILRGGLVADPVSGSVSARDIVVRHGRIAASDPTDANLPVVDVSDHLVIAGLVNGHTHGHANFAKGVADRWPLELSLLNGPWLGGSRTPEEVYTSTLLGAYDMIMRGVTACYDLAFGFPEPDPEHLTAIARAYHDAGLRAVIAPMVADIPFLASIPGLAEALPPALLADIAGKPADPDRLLTRIEDALSVALPDGVSLGLAPTIPHQCSAEFLRGCAALARERGLPLHMHVAENRTQAEVARDLWGGSPVDRLEELGLLGPDFIAAHAVWLEQRDYATLARHGAGVAHIPASNFRLGAGIAPLATMRRAGLRVGLATDGANSSDGLSMFEAMRLASHASRVFGLPSEQWVTSAEAYRMATQGGADLLAPGTPAPLTVGAPADLVCLTLDHVSFWPPNDLMTQMVTAETGSAVRHVFAGGRTLVRDGACQTIDPATLRAAITRCMPELGRRTARAKTLAGAATPHVLRFLETREAPALGFSRTIPEE